MGNTYEELEPDVSLEQEKTWNKIDNLSQAFSEMIAEKKSNALDVLINASNSSEVKLRALDDFFEYRMNPEHYTVKYSGDEYKLSELENAANALHKDNTFAYSDAPLIINNLDFFRESITLDDITLGYHYHRLLSSDKSLSHLVKLVGYYTQSALEMCNVKTNYEISNEILSHTESVDIMNKILVFVDKYLREYGSKRKKYESKYDFNNEDKLDFYSRIDLEGAQETAKIDATDIKCNQLFDLLCSCEGCNISFEFGLKVLIDGLYNNIFIAGGLKCEPVFKSIGTNPAQWKYPTFADLIDLSKQFSQHENKQSDIFNRYAAIYNFLKELQGGEFEHKFNQICVITTEEIEEATQFNDDIDTDAAFNNLKRCLPFIFVVINVSKIIPEFSSDKNVIKWRETICRKLCDIYKEDDAFEEITENKSIDVDEIIENERKVSENKNKLFKSFLMLHQSSSVEEIMRNRLELLDKAKFIAPEDYPFLEECSKEILQQIQNEIKRDDLLFYEKELRMAFGEKYEKVLSDNIICSLATAELLFHQYANEKYATNGFDFSCISALYYQAFENAYNEMIWSKYADSINKMIFLDGQNYYDTVMSCYDNNHDKKNILSPNCQAFGFLPSLKTNWNFYVDKKEKKVKDSCMYGAFSKFIDDNVYPITEIPRFYEWLANKIGFSDAGTMLSNVVFNAKLNNFRSSMASAVNNRNNASHGGSVIDVMQCKSDKDTVLSDLQEVRNTNLGLIQQLLSLYCFNL